MKGYKIFSLKIQVYICCLIIAAMVFIQCKNGNKETAVKQNQIENKQTQKNNPPQEPLNIVYDNEGNIVERHNKVIRKTDNKHLSDDYYYYKYDEKKNVIEETTESYHPDGTLNYKNVNFYTYNNYNQKIELKFFSYNGNGEIINKARNTFQYNNQGLCNIEHSYGKDDKLFLKIIRYTNDSGEITSEEFIEFNHDGSIKDHKKFHYNNLVLEKTEDLMNK